VHSVPRKISFEEIRHESRKEQAMTPDNKPCGTPGCVDEYVYAKGAAALAGRMTVPCPTCAEAKACRPKDAGELQQAETPWDAGKQALALAALEWERLRRGMPGSTPETIAKAEQEFWAACGKLAAVKLAMLRKHIEDARAASPDGMTSWDRVEKYRIEHGHLPRQDGKKEPTCKACMESQA
jgi:hypothetical protein